MWQCRNVSCSSGIALRMRLFTLPPLQGIPTYTYTYAYMNIMHGAGFKCAAVAVQQQHHYHQCTRCNAFWCNCSTPKRIFPHPFMRYAVLCCCRMCVCNAFVVSRWLTATRTSLRATFWSLCPHIGTSYAAACRAPLSFDWRLNFKNSRAFDVRAQVEALNLCSLPIFRIFAWKSCTDSRSVGRLLRSGRG